jgi:sulfate adenylyltransferase subunit 2
MWKTEGLKQALDKYGFDAAFGGARRDEEKSRAKERIFSFRDRQHRWDPKRQRPELWSLYNVRKNPGREHPRLPAVQLDRARRLAIHPARGIEIVPLYFAAPRPTVERDGLMMMVDDERLPLERPARAVSNARCASARSAAIRCPARSRARRRRRGDRRRDAADRRPASARAG